MDVKKILKGIFIFDSLNDKELDSLARASALVKVKKNFIVFREDDPAEAFYFIVQGKVKIHKISPSGDEQILHIHEEGDLVAEAAMFSMKKYPAFCKSLKEGMLLKIPKKEFIEMITKKPEIALKILASYSRRLKDFVSMIEDLSLNDTRQKLIKYIIKNTQEIDGKMVCKIKSSKKELASLLGTWPETISRGLKVLREDGLILEKGGLIFITDMKKLKSIVLM